MKIDEIRLRAYVDGEASVAERGRVETALCNNDELKRQADAMYASRLPYRAAFDVQRLPALPLALKRELANLESAAATASIVMSVPSRTKTQRWYISLGGAALAASFAAGVMLNAAWLRGGAAKTDVEPMLSKNEPWVQPIVS